MSEVECLGEEMRSWADNMPDAKQGSDKQQEVETAADTLEEQAQADPVESEGMSFLNEVKIIVQDPTPKRQPRSRSTRLHDALAIMEDVIMKLDEHTWSANEQETADDMHGKLEEIRDELEGVEFPGMYG